jgi:hypothetical protein
VGSGIVVSCSGVVISGSVGFGVVTTVVDEDVEDVEGVGVVVVVVGVGVVVVDVSSARLTLL